MATTAAQIINGALRTIGVLASGEQGKPAEMQDALSALNQLIDHWSNDSILIPSLTEKTYPLLSTKRDYTYGDGGDFNDVRPMNIEYAQIVDNAGYRWPCALYGATLYAQNIRPAVIRPQGLYYEASYPLGVVHFPTYPYDTDSLVLYVIEPLANIANITDPLELPKGYDRALKLNLAVELAAEYGGVLTPATAQLAQEARRQLETLNARVETLTFDFTTTDRTVYNIIQGPIK